MLRLSFIFSLIALLISVWFSSIIATSVQFKDDELGALFNIYVPVIAGAASILLLAAFFMIIKNTSARTVLLNALIVINIITGCLLKFSFHDFFDETYIPVNAPAENNLYNYTSYSASTTPDKGVVIENTEDFPGNYSFVFSLVNTPWKNQAVKINSPYNLNHNAANIRIRNQNNHSLTINRVTFSKSGLWKISKINNLSVDDSVFPITISPGKFVDISVLFTANKISERIKPTWWKAIFRMQYSLLKICRYFNFQYPFGDISLNIDGKLYVDTDDAANSIKVIRLNSIWQYHGESEWEPSVQKILNAFNLKTRVGFKNMDNGIDGKNIIPNSDEVLVSGFVRADSRYPVKIIQLAAYHGCCLASDADTLKYYLQTDHVSRSLFSSEPAAGQMILPPVVNADGNTSATFVPTGSFGFQIGSSFTDRNRNFDKKIGIRVWKAINDSGQQIQDTYIIGTDYLNSPGTNYDYQDDVYYITNVLPKTSF